MPFGIGDIGLKLAMLVLQRLQFCARAFIQLADKTCERGFGPGGRLAHRIHLRAWRFTNISNKRAPEFACQLIGDNSGGLGIICLGTEHYSGAGSVVRNGHCIA
ncbi:hypothetical protein D3C87_1666650 [compost metagenome]